MKLNYQKQCLRIAILIWLIPLMVWLVGCAHKPFFKVVDIGDLKVCITDDPTRYRPFPEKGVEYLGFTLLDSNVIYVKGYRQLNSRIVPNYQILGHELSCLMRHKDPEIETLFEEKVLGD